MDTKTSQSDGFNRSLRKTDVNANEVTPGWLVWVYDGLFLSGGPGSAKLATVRIFDSVDGAETWAKGVRDYKIIPLGEIPEDADPASVQAVRQMINR